MTATEAAQVQVQDFRGRVVLVTGPAGFIGSHLVDALLDRGARVRGLDNFATGKRENLPSGNGGRRTTVRELARSVREAAGGGPEPVTAPPRTGDVLHSLADLTRVGEAIGYKPQWDLSRGFARSVEYYTRAAAPGSAHAVAEEAAR